MDAGEYVPDEVTNLMVRDRIDEPDAVSGFLLDGYPRTQAQVDELDGMIAFTGHRLDAVVVLTVDRDEIVAAPAAAGRGRGPRRRHRGRHPAAPGGLRRGDRAAHRDLPRPGHPDRGRRHGRGRRGHPAHLRRARRGLGELTQEPLMSWRDRGVEVKTPEQVASMRRAGLVVWPHPRGAADRRAPRDDHRRSGRHRRGRHPHRRRVAVVPRLPGLPGLDLHLGERRGRARHPRRPRAA